MQQIQNLPGIEANVSEQQEADEDGGELYYYAMLTE